MAIGNRLVPCFSASTVWSQYPASALRLTPSLAGMTVSRTQVVIPAERSEAGTQGRARSKLRMELGGRAAARRRPWMTSS